MLCFQTIAKPVSAANSIDEQVEEEINGLEAYINNAFNNIIGVSPLILKITPVSSRKSKSKPGEFRSLYHDEVKLLDWKTQAEAELNAIKKRGIDTLEEAKIRLKTDLKDLPNDQKDTKWHTLHEIVKKCIGEMMHYLLTGVYVEITLSHEPYVEITIDEKTLNTPVMRVPSLMIEPYKKVDNFVAYCAQSAELQKIEDVQKLLDHSIDLTIDRVRKRRNSIMFGTDHLGDIQKRSKDKVARAVEGYCDRKLDEIQNTSLAVLLKTCFTGFIKIMDAVRQSVMTELLAVSAHSHVS